MFFPRKEGIQLFDEQRIKECWLGLRSSALMSFAENQGRFLVGRDKVFMKKTKKKQNSWRYSSRRRRKNMFIRLDEQYQCLYVDGKIEAEATGWSPILNPDACSWALPLTHLLKTLVLYSDSIRFPASKLKRVRRRFTRQKPLQKRAY